MKKRIIILLILMINILVVAEDIEKKISKVRYDELGNKKIHTFFFDNKGRVYREEERTETERLVKIYRFLEYTDDGKIKKISIDNWETGKITKLDFYYNGKRDLEKVVEKDSKKKIIRVSDFFKKGDKLVERVKDANGNDIKVLSYDENSIEDITKDFYKEKDEIKSYVKKIQEEKQAELKLKEDPYYDYYKLENKIKEDKNKVIAKVEIDIFDDNIYEKETVLGQIVADAVKEYSGANIVFINSGILKNGIKVGEISFGDIERVIGEDEYLSYIKVKGELILEFFEKRYKELRGDDFLNSAGIKYNLNDKGVKIEGFYIDPYKTYLMACNSSIYNGKGEYDYLINRAEKIEETKVKIRVILSEYLERLGIIDEAYILEKREER